MGLGLLLLLRLDAQPADAPGARAQAYLSAQERVHGFSGAVLLVRDGQTLLRTAIGPANREWNAANTPETKFRIGSLTKQFTATAVLLLEAAGKLQVADPLGKHLPDTPPAWADVTLHHLLTHTSGIPNFTEDPQFSRRMHEPASPAELIGRFREKPLEFPPGSGFRYSNSGYILLGAVIERASGLSYDQYLRRNILDPLGMKDTGYEKWTEIVPQRAEGYARYGSRWIHAAYQDMSQPHAAGALYSTVDDLYRWHQALLTGRILPQPVQARMFTPVRNGYGYGWNTITWEGRKVTGHSGGINGFSSYIGRIPEEDTVVVVLSNYELARADRIGRDLLRIAFDLPVDLPREPRRISLRPDIFDRYTGTYALRSGVRMAIWREGNRFLAEATGQPALEIVPESETVFFPILVDARIVFQTSAGGAATGLILEQNGRKTPGKKVK